MVYAIRDALDAFVEVTQQNVTGSVKMKLYKGNMLVSAVDTKNALYDKGISSFGTSELYDQKDAGGFIKCFSLPSKINAMVHNLK